MKNDHSSDQADTTGKHPDGTPMSAQQFMEMLFGKLPEFFDNEAEAQKHFVANSAFSSRAQFRRGMR